MAIWLLTYSCCMTFYCWHSFLSSGVPYLDKSFVSSNSDKTTLFTKKTKALFEWSIFLYLCCYNVSLWNKSYGEAILVNNNFLKGTSSPWIWITTNKIILAIFFMIFVSVFHSPDSLRLKSKTNPRKVQKNLEHPCKLCINTGEAVMAFTNTGHPNWKSHLNSWELDNLTKYSFLCNSFLTSL